MGNAIGARFHDAGNTVSYVEENETAKELGDIIVLAVPYAAVSKILETYKHKLEGKIIIDITNPVDFSNMDALVVPADSSAANEIAKIATKSFVVKAFNVNFASTVATKLVAGKEQTTLLLVSDYTEVKKVITDALSKSGLTILDAGTLKRARELEAMGFLQITLAVRNQISWTGGFALLK